MWLFHARLFDARLFRALFFDARRRSSFGHGFTMARRFAFLRLGFALHLQPVFFQLLRIDRLFRATLMLRLRVLRPPLAAVGTITAIAAATAAAASIAPPAARLFAFLTRRTVAVFRVPIRALALLHGRPGLLLRARVALLIGPPLTLRPFALRAFCLRLL